MKEHVLLKNSQVIESDPSYKWFRDLLNEYDDITTDVVNGLSNEQQNFFDNMLPKIIQQAISEWKTTSNNIVVDTGEVSGERRCSICNAKLRYIVYLQNSLNGKELGIGTTCAKHFGFNNGKSFRKLKEEARRISQLNILNEEFPGIANTIDNWNKKIDEFEVIIPLKYEEPYFKLYRKLKSIYDDFLNKKIDESCFKKIEYILNKKDDFLEAMKNYSDQNADNIYVPKKSVGKWLRKNNKDRVLETLKKEERLGIGTIHRIAEPSFVEDMIPEINNKIFNPVNAEIIYSKGSKYIYKFKSYSNVKLNVPYQEIVLDYCYFLFDRPPVIEINKKSFLEKSNIADINSYESILDYLSKKLKSRIYYYDLEYNDMFIHDGDYYQYNNLSTILEATKFHYFDVKQEPIKLNSRYKSKPYNKIDVDELINRRQYF